MVEIWDLALSSNGDLVFSGAKDLSGISGTDLLEQRMRLRLRLHRGEWQMDDDDKLGSQLWQVTGMQPARAQAMAPAYVRDALRDMGDEIGIDDIQVLSDQRSITLIVGYHVLDDFGGAQDENDQSLEITIPFGGTV